ncbi:SIMPL domain-containing protein [Flavobacterium pallidum]|uniref:SIMPL domain-containing protein n=1 Tax=Flavobacterium pallidum TaxID=2172098 RepID=A0A2S1SG20_9FLAO|nr:SIMPL domain-containing protein [Flavobacterium pallidum]AWI25319.1 hypothetical protein HYN49_05075 [Flavobacterium pallidum]
MKRILLQLMLCCSLTITAQIQPDQRKFIEVKGSAEMSVQPDDIELEIVLRRSDSDRKADLSNTESAFYAVLKKNNIKTETVTFQNTSYWYWWYWWNDRYNSNPVKVVRLKLDAKTNFLKLVEDLNTNWVQSIRIAETTAREITRLRKEVKIQAMKAAKEKASYLLESVGEEVGSLLSVVEVPESDNNYYPFFDRGNLASNSVMQSTSTNTGVEGANAIKLRYEIQAKFEIQ